MNTIASYLSEIQSTIHQLHIENIEKVIHLLHEARLNYQHVFVLGNGGSSATASHFVCDLAKSTRISGCPDFRVIGLSDNMPLVTAYSNDEGYENVFVKQLVSLLEPEDVVIAFSASGNSENVVRCIKAAKQMGAKTIGFTGSDGGKLGKLVQVEINVQNPRADQVEDVHLMLAHLVSRVLGELAKPSIVIMDAMHEPNGRDNAQKEKKTDVEIVPQMKEAVTRIIDQSLQTLQDIGQSMVTKQDEESRVLGRVLLKMIFNFGATSGSLIVLDEKGKVAESILAYQEQAWTSNRRRMIKFLDKGLSGWVVKNRQGVLIPDTSEDPRWIGHPENDHETTSYSVISVPLRLRDRICGVITLSRPGNDHFTNEDLSMLTAMMMSVNYSPVPSESRGEDTSFTR